MKGAIAVGYAIKSKEGKIDVRTISPTPRVAKVNYLVTHGIQIMSYDTDEFIDKVFDNCSPVTGVTLIGVNIMENNANVDVPSE